MIHTIVRLRVKCETALGDVKLEQLAFWVKKRFVPFIIGIRTPKAAPRVETALLIKQHERELFSRILLFFFFFWWASNYPENCGRDRNMVHVCRLAF